MDMELDLIEESYATFYQFNIDIPKDDADLVYGLRYAFQNMLLTVHIFYLKLLEYLTLACLIWFWCLRWCSHNKCNRRSSICKVPCRKSWPRVCQRSTLMCSSLMLITMRLVPWHLDYPPERLQTGKKVHRYSFKFLTLYCITNMYKLSNHLTVLPHGV